MAAPKSYMERIAVSKPEVIQLQLHPPYEVSPSQLTGLQRVSFPSPEQCPELGPMHHEGTHPTSAVLSDAGYSAKGVTLSLALRS